MLAVITYDIVSNRRRARLHRLLKEYGLNTQKSVFECDLDRAALVALVASARRHLDPEEDSFRVYRACEGCRRKVAISGQGIRLLSLDYVVV